MKNLKVLDHAIQQYRKRVPSCQKKSDKWVETKLLKIVETGREWEVKPDKRLMQLLMHECQAARYFVRWGLMVIVADGMVKTCHKNTCNRFIPKPLPVSSIPAQTQKTGT